MSPLHELDATRQVARGHALGRDWTDPEYFLRVCEEIAAVDWRNVPDIWKTEVNLYGR